MTIWRVKGEYTTQSAAELGGPKKRNRVAFDKLVATFCPLGSAAWKQAAGAIIGERVEYMALHNEWEFVVTSIERLGDCAAPEDETKWEKALESLKR